MDNFSNYSAFHYRSKVLEQLPDREGAGAAAAEQQCVFGMDIVREELDMVVDAAFTEPYDQSAWWYHRFLLDWADRRTGGGGGGGDGSGGRSGELDDDIRNEFLDVLRGQVEDLRGLVEMEEQCKWAHITLAQTIMRLRAVIASRRALRQQVEGDGGAGEVGVDDGDGGGGDDDDDDEEEEDRELKESLDAHFERLREIDPQRSGFYAAMRRKAGLAVVD